MCVFSCIQFVKMGLASIYWRLGIQQSWRSEGRELVAKPADVCLCHNLVHLLTRLGFKSSEMLIDVEFSLQLKHNSTVSEARFVLLNSGFFKIDFGPALILLSLHVADGIGCIGEGCTCSLLPPWVGWTLHRVGRGRTSLPR